MSKKQSTAELNQHLDSLVSMIIVRRHLHKQNTYGRATINKPLVPDVNAKHRLQWHHTHKTWKIHKWKKAIWSDESSFTLFPTTGWVQVWRTPVQAYACDHLIPIAIHGGGRVMIWVVMLWSSAGPIITLKKRINGGGV
ncbi:DDE_3 domain-containing protein [Trichonephila clavipes]|nr:DDE_3 domain-containing protein [Trichonephila clavipes]